MTKASRAAGIEGRYIVVLHGEPVSDGSLAVVAELLAVVYSGTVGFVYDSAFRGFSVWMDAENARRLAGDPAVKCVQRTPAVHEIK